MDMATQVQILDEVDCILYSTNTHGKGMNPIILLPTIGKEKSRLGSLALIRQPVKEKENSQLKPIGLMSREFDKTGVQSQVESYQRLKKWYLKPPCITLSMIR